MISLCVFMIWDMISSMFFLWFWDALLFHLCCFGDFGYDLFLWCFYAFKKLFPLMPVSSQPSKSEPSTFDTCAASLQWEMKVFRHSFQTSNIFVGCGTFAAPSRYLCSICEEDTYFWDAHAYQIFGLWHFCRAKKILVQYLCYAHFFGDLCQPCWKQVLYCGTFAEPKRYLYSIFAIHMVLGGGSLSILLKESFGPWHFCRAKKILVQYLCYAHGFGGSLSTLKKFCVTVTVALLQSHKDTCAVSLHIFAMPLVLDPQMSRPHISRPQISRSQDCKTPNFKTPNFNTSNVKTPHFNTPNFKTPNVKTPHFKTPHFKTPNFKTPKFKTPHFQTPNVKTPHFKTSNVKTPNFKTSHFKTPNLKTSNFNTPNFKTRNVKTLQFKTQNFKTPHFKTPNFSEDLGRWIAGYPKKKVANSLAQRASYHSDKMEITQKLCNIWSINISSPKNLEQAPKMCGKKFARVPPRGPFPLW